MVVTDAQISDLERNERWQATAVNKHGYPVVRMRGCPGALYEKDYYTLPLEVAYPFTLDGIRHQFTSGELKLVRGIIPEAESQIAWVVMPHASP
jgi:hypothetical protein